MPQTPPLTTPCSIFPREQDPETLELPGLGQWLLVTRCFLTILLFINKTKKQRLQATLKSRDEEGTLSIAAANEISMVAAVASLFSELESKGDPWDVATQPNWQ